MAEEGNTASMRAALQQASYFLHRHHMGAVYAPDGETLIYCDDVAKIVDDAIAAPQRNCDVGSPEEQTARIRKFCRKYPDDCQGCPCCPDPHADNCWLVWAQMPYEEAK